MPSVEVSIGELLDKWTVLKIKSERLQNSDQLANVMRELDVLYNQVAIAVSDDRISNLMDQLRDVNVAIWRGMDSLDALESDLSNLADYGACAREVTALNRQRSLLKREINILAESELVEEKSYF